MWRWPRNKVVRYHISSTLDLYQTQIRTAISAWNSANGQNGSGVSFVPSDSSNPPILHFFRDTSQATAGRTVPNNTMQTLEGAAIFLNTSHSTFQAGASGSGDFWTKVVSHELGHTMGMDNATGSCSEQPNGGSVMNMICGQNDNSGNMAAAPSTCDQSRVSATYPPSNYSSGSYYYQPSGSSCDVAYWNLRYFLCDPEGCNFLGSDFYYRGVTCGY